MSDKNKQPEIKTIKLNDIEYVRLDDVTNILATSMDGLPYKIVRTKSAGVFAGYVESRNGDEVVMEQARRLWYWDGAASLSQLAIDGVSKPDNCKFPEAVSSITLLGVIEIIDVTAKAQESINQVKIWKA